jgi:hypothetical protein
MTKNKKREKFFLWLEQYEAFKTLANEKGVSASELLKEAVDQFQPPAEMPKKARNLTIDKQTSQQIQSIADQWFSSSTGNRSDAVQFIIEQYLKS